MAAAAPKEAKEWKGGELLFAGGTDWAMVRWLTGKFSFSSADLIDNWCSQFEILMSLCSACSWGGLETRREMPRCGGSWAVAEPAEAD